MAAYIPVPRDLTRVKSKILFNLTKRQLLCFGAGALIGVPSFFLLKADGNTSMASICMILIMMPFFFLGMYERDGQPLEKIAKQFIQAKFVRPKVRPYQTNNYYAVLLRQAQAEMKVKIRPAIGMMTVSETLCIMVKTSGEKFAGVVST